MMSFWDILLLSVALAMDCFAVSIASGVILTPSSSPKGDGSPTLNPSPVGKESPTPNPSPVGRGTRKDSFMGRVLEGALRLSVLFGLFQAGMPLVGWFCTNWLAERIEAYDHWIAFGLLAFLGGRMIRDAFSDEEEAHHFDPTNWWTGIVLAVATSIDALAVGISLAVTGYHTIRQLAMPLVVIGLGSFLFAMLGHWLGMRFGSSIRRRLQPELLGGIILIGIGVKVLITHLCDA